MGESYQLALVPWSCALNDDTAILTCTPAYLALITTPGECTLSIKDLEPLLWKSSCLNHRFLRIDVV